MLIKHMANDVGKQKFVVGNYNWEMVSRAGNESSYSGSARKKVGSGSAR